MRASWPTRILLATIGVLTVAVAAAGWLRIRSDTKLPADFLEVGSRAYVLAAPDEIPSFQLVRQDGQAFVREDLKGRWTFIFFGFTHCPDVCPSTLGALDALRRELEAAPAALQDTRFALVTVDPERDTPEVLRRYLSSFKTPFVGVSGDPKELERAFAPVGMTRERVASATGQGYHLDHSSSIVLVDPQARLHGIFAAPHSAPSMAQAYLEMRRAHARTNSARPAG